MPTTEQIEALVERLRRECDGTNAGDASTMREAADTIAELRAENARLRDLAKANNDLAKHYTDAFNAERERGVRLTEALKPFADCVEQIADAEDDEEWAKFRLLIKDYRNAARAILAST